MDQTRRRFLFSVAALASLAGCQGSNVLSTASGPTTPFTKSPQTSPTESVSPTPSTDTPPTPSTESPPTTTHPTGTHPSIEPLYQGETVPSSPNAPAAAVPPIGIDFKPSSATPVLTADDVTDYGEVEYVADPFMFVENGQWHMFFEIVNKDKTPDAPIGHATSPNGLDWTYDQIVLKKKYHTSFPLVWKYRGEYYMCPPTGKRVELYKARSFPTDWRHIGNAIDVDYYSHDPTFVRYQGRWWLFTDRGNENVMVYHSKDLTTSGWQPHDRNPVVTDRLKAGRQGGRPVVHDGRLFLYFQDSVENYGDRIRCYEVTDLSPATYNDREVSTSPLLHEFGDGWAGDGMHTFDPWWLGPGKGWRCAVDGIREQNHPEDLFTIGIAHLPPRKNKTG